MIKKYLKKLITAAKIIKMFKNWPTFFLNYFGVRRKKSIMLQLRDGTKIYTHNQVASDIGVIGEVLLQDTYALIKKIKNPKIILDFGAHVGSFSLMAHKLHPKAKIYSFEASKETFELLKKNVEINKPNNITPFHNGISKKNETLDFYISEQSMLNSFDKTRQKNSKKSYKVKCKKISTIFKELKIKQCDFLKLDIEGFELDVLKSAVKDKILSKIKAMVIEMDRPNSPKLKEAKKILIKNGFTVHQNVELLSAIKK